jgi:ABC-2 type transport system permease protein
VIGAAFVIGLPLAANGTLSRYAVLPSEPILAIAPDAGSLSWWPARAMLGDGFPLAAVLAVSLLMLGAAIAFEYLEFVGGLWASMPGMPKRAHAG